jgi:co-chaperonin GroES (HSP10)
MSNARDFESLEEAFPAVDFGVKPLGSRLLIQLKAVKKASKGGIILVDETRETEKVQSLIGKVIAMGPLAFKSRDSATEWPEGAWCKVGDYVRIPRWSGDRFSIPHPTEPDEEISGQVLNDFECWATIDPDKVLTFRAFV